MEALAARPTFILHEAGAKVDAVFSLPLDAPGAFASYRWFLDFTDGGKHPGVVMSQSRMREIETIVNPLGTGFSPVDAMPLLGLVSGSWVDLLVCVECCVINVLLIGNARLGPAVMWRRITIQLSM